MRISRFLALIALCGCQPSTPANPPAEPAATVATPPEAQKLGSLSDQEIERIVQQPQNQIAGKRPYIVLVQVDQPQTKISIDVENDTLPEGTSIDYRIDVTADGSFEYEHLKGDFELPIEKVGTYLIAFAGDLPRARVSSAWENTSKGPNPPVTLLGVLQWGDSLGVRWQRCLCQTTA